LTRNETRNGTSQNGDVKIGIKLWKERKKAKRKAQQTNKANRTITMNNSDENRSIACARAAAIRAGIGAGLAHMDCIPQHTRELTRQAVGSIRRSQQQLVLLQRQVATLSWQIVNLRQQLQLIRQSMQFSDNTSIGQGVIALTQLSAGIIQLNRLA
jgi:hypothetical protein